MTISCASPAHSPRGLADCTLHDIPALLLALRDGACSCLWCAACALCRMMLGLSSLTADLMCCLQVVGGFTSGAAIIIGMSQVRQLALRCVLQPCWCGASAPKVLLHVIASPSVVLLGISRRSAGLSRCAARLCSHGCWTVDRLACRGSGITVWQCGLDCQGW